MEMNLSYTKSLLLAFTAAFAAVNCAYAQELSVNEVPVLKKTFTKNNWLLNTNHKPLDKDAKTIFTKNHFASKLNVEGGVHSGGGTLVKFSKGIGLLDLYVHNRADFYDTSQAVQLPESPSFQKFGIDFLDHQSEIFQKTLRKILAWEKLSPLLATNLKKAFINLPIFYINGSFKFIDSSYVLPTDVAVPEEFLQLGALYIKNFGVLISKIDFEKLSEKNQIALLIHEALRHQQISFDQDGLDNYLLQKLTAKLMQEPTETLDLEDYLTGDQLWVYQNKAKVLKEIQETSRALCPRFPKTCTLTYLNQNLNLKDLSKKLYQITGDIGRVANNTIDPKVGMEYHRAHSALLNAWSSLINLNMGLESQAYREVLFDFEGTNELKVYLQKYNSQEPTDSNYAHKFLVILQQFQDVGLIQTP